jgi:hypothetical protein
LVYPVCVDSNSEIRIDDHKAMAFRWFGVGVDCNSDAALAYNMMAMRAQVGRIAKSK